MRKTFTIIAALFITAASFWGFEVSSPKADAQTMKRSLKMDQETPPVTATVVKQEEAVFEIPAKRIDNVISIQADGREIKELVRVFSGGSLIDYPDIVYGLVRKSGTYYSDTKTLVVRGEAFGSEVVEDIRILELDGDHGILLRDIYLDGQSADLSVGRGLPFEISDESGAQDLTGAGKQVKGEGPLMAAAVATPKITSIGGVTNSNSGISNGKVDLKCGPAWNGYYAINNETGAYPITLNGSNFGSTQGSVVLAGRSARIISWSNTSIKIDPTYPYDAGPVCAVLKITTASGGVLNSGLNVVSAIKTRLYGQCTHHVASNRLKMGKQPSPTAYGGYTTISKSYVPAVGDQYQFNNGGHTAIVVRVSGPTLSTGGVKTWTLTVSEQNYDCKNSVRQYTTYFQTKTVGTSTSVQAKPKASYGNHESTSYYR